MTQNPGAALPAKPKAKFTIYHSLGLLAILVAIVLIGLSPSPQNPNRVIPWLAILILIAASTLILSSGISGSWRGLLIDNRNKVSVSRTQMFLWTILIISAIITAGITNSRIGSTAGPMSFNVPSELWLLMGISTTSLVASPLIRSTKTDKEPDPDQVDKTVTQMQQQTGKPLNVENQGLIIVNEDPKDASFADMFKGEETGNAAQLDLAKVQMFYFTIGLVLAYGVAIATIFSTGNPVTDFPAVSQGMIALLGISHAGYLTTKAIPHSNSADATIGQPIQGGGTPRPDNQPVAAAAAVVVSTPVDPEDLANAKG